MKNWTKGDRVVQPTYGAGTLVEVNEHHTVIDFDVSNPGWKSPARTRASRLSTPTIRRSPQSPAVSAAPPRRLSPAPAAAIRTAYTASSSESAGAVRLRH